VPHGPQHTLEAPRLAIQRPRPGRLKLKKPELEGPVDEDREPWRAFRVRRGGSRRVDRQLSGDFRSKAAIPLSASLGPSALRPVWTALLWQGLFEHLHCWSVRPCVRPVMRPFHRRWP
jgi:hypothetical protein